MEDVHEVRCGQEAAGGEPRREALLMFSGGRGSMLAAARLVRSGYDVSMIGFDNGHLQRPELIGNMAFEVASALDPGDEGHARFVGTINTASTMYALARPHMEGSAETRRYAKYPTHRLMCGACRTAMLCSAIRYCKAHGIDAIAVGDMEAAHGPISDPGVVEAVEKFLSGYGIRFLRPSWDVCDPIAVMVELGEAGIHPNCREAHCWSDFGLFAATSGDSGMDAGTVFRDDLLPRMAKHVE